MKSVRLTQIFHPNKEKAGRRVVLCGGFGDDERIREIHQDDGAELISASLNQVQIIPSRIKDRMNHDRLIFSVHLIKYKLFRSNQNAIASRAKCGVTRRCSALREVCKTADLLLQSVQKCQRVIHTSCHLCPIQNNILQLFIRLRSTKNPICHAYFLASSSARSASKLSCKGAICPQRTSSSASPSISSNSIRAFIC